MNTQINHIDGNPYNNDPANLRIVTVKGPGEMLEHTREEYLSWFKCRSVGETFTSDDWVARDLLFAEVKRLSGHGPSLKEGMMQAVWTLRNAANAHEAEAALKWQPVLPKPRSTSSSETMTPRTSMWRARHDPPLGSRCSC